MYIGRTHLHTQLSSLGYVGLINPPHISLPISRLVDSKNGDECVVRKRGRIERNIRSKYSTSSVLGPYCLYCMDQFAWKWNAIHPHKILKHCWSSGGISSDISRQCRWSWGRLARLSGRHRVAGNIWKRRRYWPGVLPSPRTQRDGRTLTYTGIITVQARHFVSFTFLASLLLFFVPSAAHVQAD